MNGYRVITIERQYASGGSEIGKLIGQKLNIPCHDHDILEKAARACDVSSEHIAYAEETTTNSLLFGLSMLTNGGTALPLSERIFAEETKIIRETAQREKCVIVGRCANYILKNTVKALNVYIYADYEMRVDRARNVYEIPIEEVEKTIRRFDKKRAGFYHANCKTNWNDKNLYHICLDSSKLGIEQCADIIAQIVRNSQ